jgi:ELWxxDGT repeat protein
MVAIKLALIRVWDHWPTRQAPQLVRDINLGEQLPGSLGEIQFASLNGWMYFPAAGDGQGYELWNTDGTAAGTVMVADIRPGGYSSLPRELTNVGGTLFFVAYDESHGQELWKSDGAAADTELVKELWPGVESSIAGIPTSIELVNVAGTLYLRAKDGIHGYELWRSDGTEAGTLLVADIAPGQNSGRPEGIVAAKNMIFFAADDGNRGKEPWVIRDNAAPPAYSFTSYAISGTRRRDNAVTWPTGQTAPSGFQARSSFGSSRRLELK